MRQQIGYHAGPIATYMLLGAVFGVAGAAELQAAELLPIQRAMYVIANIFLLILGFSLATRTAGVGRLQRVSASVFATALLMLRPLLQRPGTVG